MIGGQISKILKSKGITSKEIDNRALQGQKRALNMLNMNTGQIMKHFNSVAEAAQYCIDNDLSKDNIKGISAHISKCCNGIRISAYKHK